MSALLQSPNLFRSLRRISEQEAITTIGRSALAARDAIPDAIPCELPNAVPVGDSAHPTMPHFSKAPLPDG